MSKEYVPYEAAHLCFGPPKKGTVADGQIIGGGPYHGFVDIYAEDGVFVVKQKDEEVSRGATIAEAIERLGCYVNILGWLPEYDEQMKDIMPEDCWDSDEFENLLRVDEIEDPEAWAAIEAYRDKFE